MSVSSCEGTFLQSPQTGTARRIIFGRVHFHLATLMSTVDVEEDRNNNIIKNNNRKETHREIY